MITRRDSTSQMPCADEPRSWVSGVDSTDLYRLTPFELASGWLFGVQPATGEVGMPPLRPRAALERLLLDALDRPPCLVAFSGGRDSSVLLALATDLARRHDRPPPVPATRVFPGDAAAEEGSWQTRVIRHLRLENWVRIALPTQCDLLGPLALPLIRRHGVLWPPTVHVFVPLLELARGGTLVTGEGGDEVFGPRRVSVIRHVFGGARRGRAALKHVPGSVGPRVLREWHWRRRLRGQADGVTWLRPRVREQYLEHLVRDRATEPMSWRRSTLRLGRRRMWVHGSQTIQRLAYAFDVAAHHPFLDQRFLSALAKHGPVLGPMSRSGALDELVGGLLPSYVVRRRSKAAFNNAYFGEYSRRFAETWQGGTDETLVDSSKLRDNWLQSVPHAASFALLQAAWLDTNTDPRAPLSPCVHSRRSERTV